MAEEKENISKISRREFLKDAGLVVGGATVGSMGILSACNSSETKTVTNTSTLTKTTTVTAPGGTGATTVTVTAMPTTASANTVKFTVNGYSYEIKVNPEWTLQHVLHDELGWTDVKDMCTGYGACGSCVVIMNGRTVLSCMVLAAECDGASIETAQGIAKSEHPIFDSYTTFHTWQCGYCTPGFLVTAKALLDSNANPTQDEIREAMTGNLCRCGTYPQHILAILDAASKMSGGA
jgi:aerobic-type carbon monoxide dehydrogenase small subunit (CoxS/CutS family)